MKKRIMLLDQDLVYGYIIDQHLKSSDAFVYLGWYHSIDELTRHLKLGRPDFILMEMPDETDLSIINTLKKIIPMINVVIISSNDDHSSVVQAFKYGANGYLLKHLDVKKTAEDLKKIAVDGVALSDAMARKIVKGFWKTNNSPLTRAETSVLKFVSMGHSSSSLAKNLEISKETAKTHLKNIYRKLNTHRKSEALERAYQERLIN
jgi:DNA-binding NarL/FixJ family response regulator